MKPRVPFVIVGVVVLIGGIALGVLAGIRLASVSPAADGFSRVTSGTPQEVTVGDDGLMLYVDGDAALRCEVTAPDGEPVVADARSSSSFTHDGVQYRSLLPIGGEGHPAGAYVVECEGTGEAIITQPMDGGNLATGIVAAVLGVLGLIGGIVLLLLGFRRPTSKQWHASWSAGPRRR